MAHLRLDLLTVLEWIHKDRETEQMEVEMKGEEMIHGSRSVVTDHRLELLDLEVDLSATNSTIDDRTEYHFHPFCSGW